MVANFGLRLRILSFTQKKSLFVQNFFCFEQEIWTNNRNENWNKSCCGIK